MQSLYRVIKNNNISGTGSKQIVTQYEVKPKEEILSCEDVEENAKAYIDSYENLAKTMVENARRKSEAILTKAFQEAQLIEQEAFSRGNEQGYEEGYRRGSEEIQILLKNSERECQIKIDDAEDEAQGIINEASQILFNAKHEYERYINGKKEEIKDLIMIIVENVLKREVKDEDSLNAVVEDILSSARDVKSIIIKCREEHCDAIREQLTFWKESLVLRGDIFVVSDNTQDFGSVIIEKENGRIKVDINTALEKLREVIDSEELML